jgi:hypothetical protein
MTHTSQFDGRRLMQRSRREELFRLALLRDAEDDERRGRAVRTLHRLHTRQLMRWRLVVDAASLAAFANEEGLLPSWSPPIRPSSREARAAIIDRRLEDLFKGLGQRIIQSKNPAEAARKLFHPPQRRGPKVKYAERDLVIAVEVQKLRFRGKKTSREKAIFEVAETRGVDSEAVRRIVKEMDADYNHKTIEWLARAGKTKVEELWEIKI